MPSFAVMFFATLFAAGLLAEAILLYRRHRPRRGGIAASRRLRAA